MFVTRWGCSPIQSWGEVQSEFFGSVFSGRSEFNYISLSHYQGPSFPHQHHCQPSHSGSGSGPQQICWLLPSCLQLSDQLLMLSVEDIILGFQLLYSSLFIFQEKPLQWFQTPWWSKSTEVQCLVLLLTFRDSNAAVAMSSMVLFSPERRWKPCLLRNVRKIVPVLTIEFFSWIHLSYGLGRNREHSKTAKYEKSLKK